MTRAKAKIIGVRVHPTTAEAIERAADRELISVPEFCRRAVSERLKALEPMFAPLPGAFGGLLGPFREVS